MYLCMCVCMSVCLAGGIKAATKDDPLYKWLMKMNDTEDLQAKVTCSNLIGHSHPHTHTHTHSHVCMCTGRGELPDVLCGVLCGHICAWHW